MVTLPIGLSSNWNLVHFARVVALVDATESCHRFLVCITEVEREQVFVEETLVNHVVEGRRNVINADAVELFSVSMMSQHWQGFTNP